MDKWVGSSERPFANCSAGQGIPRHHWFSSTDRRDGAAPRQSFDSGVTDRVVASLLTELDGIEPCATWSSSAPPTVRTSSIRPSCVPAGWRSWCSSEPPDADARREILRTAGKSVPLSADVDLDKLATELDGYSAADCVALLREAALTAMRRSIDAADVTAADVTKARETVRPSLDPVQVESLRAFAEGR